MIHHSEENRQAVIQSCERHGFTRLYVFGSSLREDYQLGIESSQNDGIIVEVTISIYMTSHT